MKMQTEEAEEPPSRPRAVHQLLPNPHRPINAHSPAGVPSLGSGLAVLTARAERFPVGPKTRAFRKKFFADASDKDWNDWRWQSRHRIRNLEQMERMLQLSEDEREALVIDPQRDVERYLRLAEELARDLERALVHL